MSDPDIKAEVELDEEITMKSKSQREIPSMRTVILAVGLIMLFFVAGVRFGGYIDGNSPTPALDDTVAEYSVDVKGAVTNPGIYTVPAGSRVEDLLALVELAPDAAPQLLNRAALITDGSELIISTASEDIDWNTLAQQRGGVYYGQSDNASSSSDNSSAAFTGVVNINTAGLDELDMLPGIGPAKAQSIIDYRNANGSFLTKEQIMNVSGIGQATYDKFKNNISI